MGSLTGEFELSGDGLKKGQEKGVSLCRDPVGETGGRRVSIYCEN